MAEEEELDKFILNHLCGEIMEEVMDLGNDQVDLIASKTKLKSKKSRKDRESIFQTLYNERSFFGTVMGLKTQKNTNSSQFS